MATLAFKNYSFEQLKTLYLQSPLQDLLKESSNPVSAWLGVELAVVWQNFEIQLAKIPIVQAIESCTVNKEQYKSFLLNLRQQVVEGARWITRAASNMAESHIELRRALISHAAQEQSDFRMLEENYVSMGGDVTHIQNHPKNIGTEALHAYISHQTGQANPTHVFGATFIIEGLGTKKAGLWAQCLQRSINATPEQVSFLSYHGQADENHYKQLIKILSSAYIKDSVAVDLVKCAKVVARLYALQLEELNHF